MGRMMKVDSSASILITGAATGVGLAAAQAVSCGANDDCIIPSDAVVSPDGKYALSSNVQEDIEDSDGKFYSIYEVKLFDKTSNALIFEDMEFAPETFDIVFSSLSLHYVEDFISVV